MNTTYFKINIYLAILVVFIAIYSCSTDNGDSTDISQITKSDIEKSLKVEDLSNFVDKLTIDRIAPGNKSSLKSFSCSKFSLLPNGYSISFQNCSIQNQNNINGSITVQNSIENGIITSTITFDKLNFGGNTLMGAKSSTYALDFENKTFSYQVTSDIEVVFSDNSIASETGTKIYTISDLGANGQYSLTGNWQILLDQNTYILETNPSLSGTFDCEYPKEGKLIINKNQSSAAIDFGNGACDSIAVATYPDGSTEEIEL